MKQARPGRATLLPIPIGKERALFRNAVDIGRLVAHDTEVVCADIVPPDVVAPDDDNVRFFVLRMNCTANRQPSCKRKQGKYNFLVV
jgi:hypothetical protein